MRLRKVAVSSLAGSNHVQAYSCCLYVIQEGDGEHYKIGVAAHPVRRLSTLQCGNRTRLRIVAAYEGSRSSCMAVEKVALKFFGAPAGSEWIWSENPDDIGKYLDAFTEEADAG